MAALALTGFAAVAGLSYLAGVRSASSPATAVRVARLTDFLGLEEYPAISPDGRSVAFTADEGGSRQIWVKLIAGGPPPPRTPRARAPQPFLVCAGVEGCFVC